MQIDVRITVFTASSPGRLHVKVPPVENSVMEFIIAWRLRHDVIFHWVKFNYNCRQRCHVTFFYRHEDADLFQQAKKNQHLWDPQSFNHHMRPWMGSIVGLQGFFHRPGQYCSFYSRAQALITNTGNLREKSINSGPEDQTKTAAVTSGHCTQTWKGQLEPPGAACVLCWIAEPEKSIKWSRRAFFFFCNMIQTPLWPQEMKCSSGLDVSEAEIKNSPWSREKCGLVILTPSVVVNHHTLNIWNWAAGYFCMGCETFVVCLAAVFILISPSFTAPSSLSVSLLHPERFVQQEYEVV